MSRVLVATVTAIGPDVMAEIADDYGTPRDAVALLAAFETGRLGRELAGEAARETP